MKRTGQTRTSSETIKQAIIVTRFHSNSTGEPDMRSEERLVIATVYFVTTFHRQSIRGSLHFSFPKSLTAHTQKAFNHHALLLTQQFPQGEQIPFRLQIPYRKAIAQQGRIDLLSRDPSPFSEPTKQERNSIFGEGTARLRDKELE
jgi:hypothetical protein